ncbi:aminodeoxychorismate synthase [Nocardia sp. NPDC050710]|uniref:uridine kinase family protein n=1 Tax=Nocardia sp. NPDC050710 TaxID=3157220 RepID=UPI0033F03662
MNHPRPPVETGRPFDVGALARRLRALRPSCGRVRLVAVDGHAGSGKSSFTELLSAELGGAPVLHLDDLATHTELFGWFERLRDQVLTPLSQGRTASYDVYDWNARRFASELELPSAPVVLLEGVGAGGRTVRPYLAQLLWMELGAETSWARGRRRDGPELAGFWDVWIPAEQRHFAADPSRPYADLLVRQRSTGFALSPGPAATVIGSDPR